MSNIPIPFIQGSTDAEKVTEIASYLKSLSSAVEREFMSIDSTNLNGDLRERIESSLTEHQDLTGFASKNYLKNHFYEKEHIETFLDSINDSISNLRDSLSEFAKSSDVTALARQVESLATTVEKLNDYVFDTGNILNVTLQYELGKIKDRLDKLEK